jgi:hypothetical protein
MMIQDKAKIIVSKAKFFVSSVFIRVHLWLILNFVFPEKPLS